MGLLDILFWIVSLLVLAYAGLMLLAFVVVGGLTLWQIWLDDIKPWLIHAREIERAAGEILAEFSDPEEEAYLRHKQAWYRSNAQEQVYWFRVRKVVRRRLGGG